MPTPDARKRKEVQAGTSDTTAPTLADAPTGVATTSFWRDYYDFRYPLGFGVLLVFLRWIGVLDRIGLWCEVR